MNWVVMFGFFNLILLMSVHIVVHPYLFNFELFVNIDQGDQ